MKIKPNNALTKPIVGKWYRIDLFMSKVLDIGQYIGADDGTYKFTNDLYVFIYNWEKYVQDGNVKLVNENISK